MSEFHHTTFKKQQTTKYRVLKIHVTHHIIIHLRICYFLCLLLKYIINDVNFPQVFFADYILT